MSSECEMHWIRTILKQRFRLLVTFKFNNLALNLFVFLQPAQKFLQNQMISQNGLHIQILENRWKNRCNTYQNNFVKFQEKP